MPTYISVENIFITESDFEAVFTLKLTGAPLAASVNIDYSLIDGTALDLIGAPADFAGTLTIDPLSGDTFTVTVLLPLGGSSNLAPTGLQGFNLQFISSDPDVLLGNSIATALVVDVDNVPAGLPRLTPGDMVVDEAAGTVTIAVMLDGPSTSDITVNFETQDATAVADDGQGGSDYTHTAGTLTILAGQTVGTFTVPINNDAVAEGRELFSVFFSSPVNATLADSRVHVVIQANDAAAVATPTVNVHGATVAENQGYVDFVVSLSAPSLSGVSMDYQTLDTVEAIQGTDFGHLAGSLVFAPGEQSKTIRVLTIDNLTTEAALSRSFELQVFNVVGATDGITTATAAIVDDEQFASITSTTPVHINASAAGDVMAGTPWNDSLQGSSGSDVLDGRAQGDSMAGGAGDDIYIVEDTGGSISEGTDEGTDTVISYFVDSDITGNPNFENLVLGGSDSTGNINLNGAGNSGANTIIGNRGNNLLSGLEGSDTLLGGAGNDTLLGGAGVDSLVGGLGDDTYTLDGDGDVVVEASGVGSGSDTVVSTASYVLTANVEKLTLSGLGNLNGTGNADANTIIGNAGDNVLDGGAGDDDLRGGAGNDTYLVDSGLDLVAEAVGQGNDLLLASVNYALGAGVEIETLILTGTATALVGNELGNNIIGANLDDTLSGLLGNDSLSGAGGNDTLLGGDGNDSLLGGLGADSLIGGDGNDTMNGGVGVDAMAGGLGNDTYFVDAATDVVTETTGGGGDTVFASVNYTLAAGAEVEALSALGSASVLTGNEFNNIVQGGALADTLSGMNGNDSLLGGAGADTLFGGTGIDTLNGGTGADLMDGGAGNDSYFVDSAADVVIEAGAGGTDVVYASTNYVLGAGVEVEVLNLLGSATALTGNEFNNSIFGGALADTLSGLGGNDSLIGGVGNDTLLGGDGVDTLNGGVGIDSMAGGLGNDIYFVDAAGDVASEVIGGGTDTLFATVNYTLVAGSEVETMNLLGSATALTGNELANTLVGGGLNDSLTGADGNDTLNGSLGNDTLDGGLGADSLIGGAGTDSLLGAEGNDTLNGGIGADVMNGGVGNDTYFVDSALDVVIEAAGAGVDAIFASTNFTLASGIEVESVSLTGTATVLTGNELANVLLGGVLGDTLSGLGGNDSLIGATGNDSLSGGDGNDTINGGTGLDTLDGGAGNDTYFVDNAGDVVLEAASGGADVLFASANYVLGAGVEVESLSLLGTANRLTGNELNNTVAGSAGADGLVGMAGNDSLIGGAGNDTLNGGEGNDTLNGGTGVDSLIGGVGNDAYFVDDAADLIVDAAGEGVDSLFASVNYVLAVGAEIETSTLVGAAFQLTGNAFNNALIGGALDDTLSGLTGNDTINAGVGADHLFGGLGNDLLTGGAGNDTFVFDTALNAATNVDTVADFTVGDHLQLSGAIFSNLGALGILAADHFFSGAGFSASTSAAQGPGIYYDTTTGAMYYDADGFNGTAGIKFATVNGQPAVTAADIIIG